MHTIDWAGDGRRSRSRLAAAAFGTVAVLAAGCSYGPSHQRGSEGAPKQLTIWLTGYSWQDNTPPGSSKVGEPVLHQVAGGTGTFADPITVATPGHAGDQAWEPGTKFYLPTVQRYVIVEDSGAAKEPEGTDTHLDMWIGGRDGTKAATDACENQFTGKVPAQVNPPDGLPVMAGEIFSGGRCRIPAQQENMGTYKQADGDDGGSDDGSDGDSGEDGGGHHHHHHHHHDDDDGN